MAAEDQEQTFARALFAVQLSSFHELFFFCRGHAFLTKASSPTEFTHRKYSTPAQQAVQKHFRFQP
jgi:hypothetical protein